MDDEAGRSGQTDGSRGWRGHQLCLPADPNTLGFFATEGLKVHPTRSPRPTGNTNQQGDNREQQKGSKAVKSQLGEDSRQPLPLRGAGEGRLDTPRPATAGTHRGPDALAPGPARPSPGVGRTAEAI